MHKLYIIKFLNLFQTIIPKQKHGITILAYHLIDKNTSLRVDIKKKIFLKHLKIFNNYSEVLSFSEFEKNFKKPKQKSCILVTFDDAYQNFYDLVWPIIYQRSIPVVLFVPVGFIENKYCSPIRYTERFSPVSWDQLKEMISSGLVTVGSHSYHHHDMRKLTNEKLEWELSYSKNVLEDRLGIKINIFCYPRAFWSRRTEEYVRKYYDYAMIAGGTKVVSNTTNPLRIPRIPVTRNNESEIFQIINSRFWIEEFIADKYRRFFRQYE